MPPRRPGNDLICIYRGFFNNVYDFCMTYALAQYSHDFGISYVVILVQNTHISNLKTNGMLYTL